MSIKNRKILLNTTSNLKTYLQNIEFQWRDPGLVVLIDQYKEKKYGQKIESHVIFIVLSIEREHKQKQKQSEKQMCCHAYYSVDKDIYNMI